MLTITIEFSVYYELDPVLRVLWGTVKNLCVWASHQTNYP